MSKKYRFNSVSKTSNIVLNGIFIIYSLICIIPLILVLMVSITDEVTLYENGYSLFPAKISFDAYRYIMQGGKAIINAYGVTIFATSIGTLISVAVILLYAYPISRKEFKYKNIFSFIIFFTLLFNGGMIPWYLVCSQFLHLRNTIWALIIPYVMNGWYVIIVRTFFSTTIPDSIIDSAKIDGAGELKTFTSIVLPLSKPVIATIALFTILNYWNDWWLPLMLIDDNKLINLQYLMYRIQASIQYLNTMSEHVSRSSLGARIPSESARMAIAMIVIGPIIFAYPYFQKYFVKGLTIGAVKG